MIEILSAYEVTKEDIAQALELDRISYDEVYYLDVETCLAYHKKNPLIYIMLKDTSRNRVVGYVNFSPVTKETFDLILSGKVIDTVIQDKDIEAYTNNHPYWGYMSSIVVHPDYRQKGYAKIMLRKLSDLVCELAEKCGIFFHGIVADAVSDAGYHLLYNMGLEQMQASSHDTRIMYVNPFSEHVRESCYNKAILSSYKQEGQKNGLSI